MENLAIQNNLFEDSKDSSAPLLISNDRPIAARPIFVLLPLVWRKFSTYSTTVLLKAWVICVYL